MDNKQLHDICDHFNLGSSISSPNRVHGGLLHLMWHIETDKGLYAIKQLSKNISLTEKVRQSYEISERVARQFSNLGIPAISAIEKNGKFLMDSHGSSFIVYPWVIGTMLENENITDYHATTIATLLAKIHLINLPVPEIVSSDYDFNSNAEIVLLIEKSVANSLPFASKLQDLESKLLAWNDRYQQAVALFQFVSVISHADLDPKNVLWDTNNQPILIDWESVRLINPAYEFLIAALDWSGITAGGFNIRLFLSMIDAYERAGGMIDYEILDSSFYGVPGNAINWMVYNIRRSLRVESSAEEQKLGIEQVNQVIKTMLHIDDKIKELKYQLLRDKTND